MCLGILRNGWVYDVYRAAVVKGQIGIGTVVDCIVPVGEEHHAVTAGHLEKGRGELSAIFEVGIETRILADAVYNSAELFFHIAVKVEKVGIFQIGKVINILKIYIGVQQSAACVREGTHNETILDRGVELVADYYVQLAGLKLGQKVRDRAAFQTEIDRGIKLFEVSCYFVVEHGGIPCFRTAQSHSAAELGD